MHFLDGTPVDPEYAAAVAALVSSAAQAEEFFDLDELERKAYEQAT